MNIPVISSLICRLRHSRKNSRSGPLTAVACAVVAVLLQGQDAFAAPTVYVPTLNANDIVVAEANVLSYGAVADGTTDCTTAFQNAINAVYKSGQRGGGVVYVPAGTYAFYGNLNVPNGVTIHGDWKDWTKGTDGAVGTILKVYTTGAADGTPFIDMYHGDTTGSNALIGVTIWYPAQSASNIQPYPWTVKLGHTATVRNVILVNSYQGVFAAVSPQHTITSVIGSPLSVGILVMGAADIGLMQDVRFSPDVWSKSGLSGSPAAGGTHASWMMANGTGIILGRVDGEFIIGGSISGYKYGMNLAWTRNGKATAEQSRQYGSPTVCTYKLEITNCSTALVASSGSSNPGNQFTQCTFQGVVGVDNTGADNYGADPNYPSTPAAPTGSVNNFHSCTITGTGGTAIKGGNAETSIMRCTVNGAIQQNYSILNVVSSTLNAPTQCTMASANVLRTLFTGCTFLPSKNIVNNSGSPDKLRIDPKMPSQSQMPDFSWDAVLTDFASRKPAKTDLFLVSATLGDGITDATTSIQNQLNAASSNGGGIVYLPGGRYKTTASLVVPAGVELRGVFETRHGVERPSTGTLQDSFCKNSRIEPTAGSGTLTGPPAVILQANAGIRGVDIVYETQNNTNPVAFPPAIQGRGTNVYAIAVTSPNAFILADLKNYSCSNHFFYDVCGWGLNTAFKVGNTSSGSIISSQITPAFWANIYDSANPYNSAIRANYVNMNLALFDLGSCTETIINDFVIPSHVMMRTTSDSGVGPQVKALNTSCDSTHWGFDLASTDAASSVQIVNPLLALVNTDGSPNDLAVIQSSASAKGYFRLFNGAVYGIARLRDFDLQGDADIGLELFWMRRYSTTGVQSSNGSFHLIGAILYSDNYPDIGTFPVYNLNFTGTSSRISEFVANVAPNNGGTNSSGFAFSNADTTNRIDLWQNISKTTYYKLEDLPYVEDDFGPGNTNFWTVYGGSWAVSAGKYTVNQGAGFKTVFPSSYGTTNVSCEADVSIANAGACNSGLIFRVQNPAIGTDAYQGYYASITGNGRVILGKADNSWTQLAVAMTTVNIGTSYRLKAVAQGSNIKVYLDDMITPKIDYTDSSFTEGASGLRAHQTPTTYDNFSAGSIVYSDRFDASWPSTEWTTYNGTWTTPTQSLAVASNPGAKALANPLVNGTPTPFISGDFTYDGDVWIDTGNAGLIFRVNNPSVGADAYQGYYAGISTTQVILGRANNNWTSLGTANLTITPNQWHHLRVFARGASIKVYLDDMTTPKVTATDATFASGGIGVRTYNSNAKFDNLMIVE